MKSTQEVALLFDAKAASWNSKYRVNGPLAYRAAAFGALLDGRTAPGAAVLDFGGGTGAIASFLEQRGFRPTVCDLSERMIATGKQLYPGQAIEWALLPQAWKRLPFADGSFDAVIASSVFEYLDNVESVLAECRRVLRPSGYLIFSGPNPAHPSRQLERGLRPAAVVARKIPGVRSLPKIGNYLSYLEVSRARYSETEWRLKAARAGFEAVAIDRGLPELAAHPGMMYLVFRNR